MRYRFVFRYGDHTEWWETLAVDEEEARRLAQDEADKQISEYAVGLHHSGALEDLVAVAHWLKANPVEVELDGSWEA